MTKDQAIAKYGEEVVEEAREYHETDAGKVLFWEDGREGDCAPSDEEQRDYLFRANRVIQHRNRSITIQALKKL